MTKPISLSSQTRILDAAERLFAEHGFNGTSLRQLATEAEVNLAAANYHFNSKEALYLEVIRRRIRPINQVRLDGLRQAVEQAGDAPPPLANVIDLMIRPFFEAHRDPQSGGRHIVQLLARSMTEPLPFTNKLLSDEFHSTLTRFSQVIRRHAPQLTPEEYLWRLSFVVGALQHTLGTLHQMGDLTRGICRSDDYEGTLARFVRFAVGVFTAPAD
ncbi:MAG: TetR/AcrR family transcriptional regulator [Opitutae bacterium]|nr:TetR/AcrR family transcriptional regulator [Opitutae bacterium]